MSKLNIRTTGDVRVDAESLAQDITDELTPQEVINFILDIEDFMADTEFTKKLYKEIKEVAEGYCDEL